MSLDTPAAGWQLPQPFTLGGWAVDTGTSTGTGVSHVEILAYPNPGSGEPAISLGHATYGIARTDVAQLYGAQFTNSGYQKEIRGLAPGWYKFVAQARSTVTGTVNQSREVTPVMALAQPRMWVDTPVSGSGVNQYFPIGGWAIDQAAGSGTGVSAIHIWAYPNPGSGQPPIWVGAPTYGGARGDVAALYGSQFLNSGFGMTANLPPGTYLLAVHALSTITNTFNQVQSITVTVASSNPVIAIDAPSPSSTVGQPFHVGGWAVDLGSPSGPGIDVVHIYAIANGGTGAWTFLGPAIYGGPRPDVAAYFGDSKFTNSAYGLNASGLAPGYYQINVYAHSTVSGLWPVGTVFVNIQ
jgi:hypothetical protein